MQTISVYLNQRASNTSFEYWKDQITRSLFRSKLQFRTPSSLGELKNLLISDIENNVDSIVSVGGDGTVNTLIQSLAHTDIGLLVIPGGTANDLAHELGTEKNIKKVIQWIRSKEMKNIDLIRVNGNYMATNGGIGIGGTVAQKINTIRAKYPVFKKLMKFTGKKIYTFFAASELLSPNLEYCDLKISCDQFNGQVHCAGLLINNQPVLAGSFHVAPGTSNQDGKFNVSILTHPNRQKLLGCVLALAQGIQPVDDPYFITFETDKLTVENINATKELEFFGDGEILTEDKQKWEVSVDQSALKVYSKCSGVDLVDLVNQVSLQ